MSINAIEVLEARFANRQPEIKEIMSESVLEEAQRLVHGDRGADYGHPYVDYLCTATMWRALILRRYGVDVPLTPDFVCLMMDVLKASREAGKSKRDNRVDGPGYWECVDMCLNYPQA